MSKRKWEKGRQIYSTGELSAIKERHSWFIVNGKTMHKSFLESMTFRTVEGFIRRGQVFAAVPANEKLLGKSTRSLTTEGFRYTYDTPEEAENEAVKAWNEDSKRQD